MHIFAVSLFLLTVVLLGLCGAQPDKSEGKPKRRRITIGESDDEQNAAAVVATTPLTVRRRIEAPRVAFNASTVATTSVGECCAGKRR